MNLNPATFQQETWAHKPDAWATGAANSAAIDTQKFRQAAFYVNLADKGAAGTLDYKIQESDDGSTGWTDVSGAAITQLTANGTARVSVNVNATGRGRYLRAVMTVGGNTVDAGSLCVLSCPINSADITATYVTA